MTLLTGEQIAAILGAADEHFRALAALRLGEAAGLQVGDVDYLRWVLLVHRQVQRAGGSAVEVRVPEYGSERTAFAPDALLELLAEHVAQHRAKTRHGGCS